MSPPETRPASLSSQPPKDPTDTRGGRQQLGLGVFEKKGTTAASLVARIHCPPPPISAHLFATNHRSGRAVVGGEGSRCFLAAIFLKAPRFGLCSRCSGHERRTRAGPAASNLQRLLVVAMVRRLRGARESAWTASPSPLAGSRVSHSSAPGGARRGAAQPVAALSSVPGGSESRTPSAALSSP